MENIVILGTGCAGLTAAIYAARANLNPLVLEGKQPGGQLTTTSEVENFPGFPEGIDGFMLMDSLRKQALKFGAKIENAYIKSVRLDENVKVLSSESKEYLSKSIIIATGAAPKLLGIKGEQEMYGGNGVTTCATCDGAFYRGMDVIVVGGGDSACEEALFLTRFCSSVTIIHRRDELRASKIMATRVLENEKITVIWNAEITEILPDDDGKVKAIEILKSHEGKKEIINAKGVFIAIGHSPNTKAFEEILPLDDNGYLVPKEGSMVKTKIPGVYVAGDCAEAERWLAEQT